MIKATPGLFEERVFSAEYDPDGCGVSGEQQRFSSEGEAIAWLIEKTANSKEIYSTELRNKPSEASIHPDTVPQVAHVYCHPASRSCETTDPVNDSISTANIDPDTLNSVAKIVWHVSTVFGGVTFRELQDSDTLGARVLQSHDSGLLARHLAELVAGGYLVLIGNRYFHIPDSSRGVLFAIAFLEKAHLEGVSLSFMERVLNLSQSNLAKEIKILTDRGCLTRAKNGYVLEDTHYRQEASRRAKERGKLGGNPKLMLKSNDRDVS